MFLKKGEDFLTEGRDWKKPADGFHIPNSWSSWPNWSSTLFYSPHCSSHFRWLHRPANSIHFLVRNPSPLFSFHKKEDFCQLRPLMLPKEVKNSGYPQSFHQLAIHVWKSLRKISFQLGLKLSISSEDRKLSGKFLLVVLVRLLSHSSALLLSFCLW